MVQTKIYGLRAHLDPIKPALSDLIYACVIEALQYPADKRAHRFFRLILQISFTRQGAAIATQSLS